MENVKWHYQNTPAVPGLAGALQSLYLQAIINQNNPQNHHIKLSYTTIRNNIQNTEKTL